MGPAPENLQVPACSEKEQRWLTSLAHAAIEAAIRGHRAPEPPPESLTETLSRHAATFVTLMLDRHLRGCVGNLVPHEPLYRSIMNNAVGAALRDTRFQPVIGEEAARLELHISILSGLVPVRFGSVAELLDQITPGQDGVVLRQVGRTSTYLPQVWKSFPNKEEFLGSLSRKAQLDASAWKEPGTEVLIYRTSEFGDPMAA